MWRLGVSGLDRPYEKILKEKADRFKAIAEKIEDAAARKGFTSSVVLREIETEEPQKTRVEVNERALDELLGIAEEAKEFFDIGDPRIFQEAAEWFVYKTVDEEQLYKCNWYGFESLPAEILREYYVWDGDFDGVFTPKDVNSIWNPRGPKLGIIDKAVEHGYVPEKKLRLINEAFLTYLNLEKVENWTSENFGKVLGYSDAERAMAKVDALMLEVLPHEEWKFCHICNSTLYASASQPKKGLFRPDFLRLAQKAFNLNVRELWIYSGAPSDIIHEPITTAGRVLNAHLKEIGAPQLRIGYRGTVFSHPTPEVLRVKMNLVTRKPGAPPDARAARKIGGVEIFESPRANAMVEPFSAEARLLAGHFLDDRVLRRPAFCISTAAPAARKTRRKLRKEPLRKELLVSDNPSDILFAVDRAIPFLFVDVEEKRVAAKLGHPSFGVRDVKDVLRYMDYLNDVPSCLFYMGAAGLLDFILWGSVLRQDATARDWRAFDAHLDSAIDFFDENYEFARYTRPYHLLLAEKQHRMFRGVPGEPRYILTHPFYRIKNERTAVLASLRRVLRDDHPLYEILGYKPQPKEAGGLHDPESLEYAPPIEAIYAPSVLARSDVEKNFLEKWVREEINKIPGQRDPDIYIRAARNESGVWHKILPIFTAAPMITE